MTEQPTKTRRQRDPRLDFFRGVAMLIIFIAHVPKNHWSNFIPARFGFSDAAEMFVFCSGFAAAIAFGGTFIKAGFWHGTGRVLYRIWQLYTAHILIFFLIAGLMLAGNAVFAEPDYISRLNLHFFFNKTPEALLGLLTLTYVPNYFDIMPMYMGALLMIPVFMALANVHPWLAMSFSLAVYSLNWIFDGGLPAHPSHDHIEWFFNPLGWQLVFFTGYSISRGWLTPPPFNRALMAACIVFVIAAAPVSHWWFFVGYKESLPFLAEWRQAILPWRAKTDYGILRFIHFLALAYIVVNLVRGREHLLQHKVFHPIRTVGQQALPVFLLNMWLAQLGGMVLDQLGRSQTTWALVNLSGLAIVVLFAYLVTAIKKEWWRGAADANREKATVRKNADTPSGSALSPAE
ncbi:OpgC domain-containing protein [Nisaea sp.]|uniref:OpgC family protein n=1 Tax=Nisaea sp. TaxID=2024842 RepID=UPI0032972A8D